MRKKSAVAAVAKETETTELVNDDTPDPESILPGPYILKATYPKLDLDKVMALFPDGFTPRELQKEALASLVKLYNQGADYVVLEAPTGSGKSLIAMTLARAMGKADLLTLTEQLQKQYLHDFDRFGLRVLTGRGKHHCARMNKPLQRGGSCRDGKHHFKGKQACANQGGCAYVSAKQEALSATYMAANYHSYLWNIGAGNSYTDEGEAPHLPDLMVCDEAHAIESFLLDQVGVTVSLTKLALPLAPLPSSDTDAAPYFDYIEKELLPKLRVAKKRLLDPRALEESELLERKLAHLLRVREAEEWIPERGRGAEGQLDASWFALKPLTVASYGKWIHGKRKRLLLMSGTVLNAWQLVTSIGLRPDEGEHLELPCPFPVENRPIFVRGLDMTMRARDESWPQMASIVDGLLTHHAKDKGLLLCPSNAMLKYIHTRLSRLNAARLVFAFGEDRTEKYQEHTHSKLPTVLAASGFWEGADLKGDASRFQILPAVPRAMWAGQVKARASQDGTWYRWLAYTKLLQGMGRSIRSETDTAITYLLDQDFINELRRKDSMIPKWVAEAVQVLGEE